MTARGGRTETPSGRPPPVPPHRAYRLKRSLEVFPASDGSLYLLRSGTGDDFVLSDPTSEDRALLELLSQGFLSESHLREALGRRGLPTGGIGDCLAKLEELGLLERDEGRDVLSPEQRRRYDRQLIYLSDLAAPGISGETLQRRLAEARVVILGCGGLGSWAACGLACAGVGSLALIDHDRVELSNLNRQLLFTEADVGEPKVEAAARTLAAHNSELELAPVRRRVCGPADLVDVLEGADLLIATADWPPYELQRWVNRACLDAAVPYISAGQFLPLVRVGPMVLPGRSACQQCLERQTRRGFPMYDEVTAAISKKAPRAATLGAASGVVGSMLAMEAIHLLTGASRPASVDTALILDLGTMRLSTERVRRDPACPECGCGEAQDLPPLRSKDEQTLDRHLGRSL